MKKNVVITVYQPMFHEDDYCHPASAQRIYVINGNRQRRRRVDVNPPNTAP